MLCQNLPFGPTNMYPYISTTSGQFFLFLEIYSIFVLFYTTLTIFCVIIHSHPNHQTSHSHLNQSKASYYIDFCGNSSIHHWQSYYRVIWVNRVIYHIIWGQCLHIPPLLSSHHTLFINHNYGSWETPLWWLTMDHYMNALSTAYQWDHALHQPQPMINWKTHSYVYTEGQMADYGTAKSPLPTILKTAITSSGNWGDTGMRQLWPEQIWLIPCDIS